jgi:hypothetical protein
LIKESPRVSKDSKWNASWQFLVVIASKTYHEDYVEYKFKQKLNIQLTTEIGKSLIFDQATVRERERERERERPRPAVKIILESWSPNTR